MNFISEGDTSPNVRQTLTDLEAQAKTEQAAIAALIESGRTPVVLPHPADLVQREFELESILAEDPSRGRELLVQLFEDGAVSCTPNENGIYIARSRFFPLAIMGVELRNTKPRSPSPVPGFLARGASPVLQPQLRGRATRLS